MNYRVELKPKAVKDLNRLQQKQKRQILEGLEKLADDMLGDTKKLTNFTPEYRLRIGRYRVLFEIEQENRIVVYRIMHRKDVYR